MDSTTWLRPLPLAGVLLFAACHPLSCWYPEGLPTDAPKELTSTSGDFPVAPVEVLFDELGVPHFYGESEADLAYALGWAHARDRLFQIVFRKHAAQGRLMELIGQEGLLSADQHQRLLTWNLEEAYALLSDRDLNLVEAYAAGVNDGYAEHGPAAEMDILGLSAGYEWEAFTGYDALSIMRLLQDNQTGRIEEALAWERVFNKLGRDHPLLDDIPVLQDAHGWPVITNEEFTGEPYPGEVRPAPRTAGDVARQLPAGRYQVARSIPARQAQKPLLPDLIKRTIDLDGPGGMSNSWAVSGEHTASGAPMLANDPHMTHDQLWYVVDLVAPDFSITGVSFAGLPVIIIGHSETGAWGLTNPSTFSEELLRLEVTEDGEGYIVDGEVREFEPLEQKYFIAGSDEPVLSETWRVTDFGPVLPPGREFLIDEGDTFVYKWTVQHYIDAPDHVSMWWDLGRATTADDVLTAASKHVGPPINMPFALQNGDIGWSVAGFIPERRDDNPPWLPRDGTTQDAAWGDRIPFIYQPQTVNPAKGWLTATNQRLVEEGGPLDWDMGPRGDVGYRAERASEELTRMLAAGKPTTDQLGDLQQDVFSKFAARLAPLFAEHCPSSVPGQPDELVEAFCAELRRWDFAYPTTTTGGLLFDRTWPVVFKHMAYAHLGPEVAEDFYRRGPYFHRAATAAFLQHAEGLSPLLLDNPETPDYDGPAYFVQKGVGQALRWLRTNIGDDPEEWTLGRVHQYTGPGVLATSPVGFLFETPRFPQSGCADCLRAEQGFPDVRYGSAMRLIVEVSDPVVGRVVGDLGQAEQFGHPHKLDMVEPWEDGAPPIVHRPRSEVEAELAGWVKLNPGS